MVRIVFILAMLLHGIGHVLFAGNAWGFWKTTQTRPALFTDVLRVPQSVEGTVGLLWLLPLIGFTAAAAGMYSKSDWWYSVALLSAVISLVLNLLFWNGINTSGAMFAVLVNFVVIAAVLAQPAILNPAR